MARSRRKKSLYEVIGRGRSDLSYHDSSEPLHADRAKKGRAGASKGRRLLAWPKGPRTVQFIAGRVEISIPYQLAIAVFLGLVLLVLVVFRLGQIYERGANLAAEVPEVVSKQAAGAAASRPAIAAEAPRAAEKTAQALTGEKKTEAAVSKGSNRIVIQTYSLRTDLEPVKKYFGEHGIATEIRRIGSVYYLVSKDKYENPARKGTDGHSAKQRIIELGAGYKAPPGYETFGTKPFHDAYGMRFDD